MKCGTLILTFGYKEMALRLRKFGYKEMALYTAQISTVMKNIQSHHRSIIGSGEPAKN